jgi:hypothetical protein
MCQHEDSKEKSEDISKESGEGEEGKATTPTSKDAGAYVLNGVETNIAAGTGIRGIRWLRKNDQYAV